MTLRLRPGHYYTRPAYTSDTAARLRRSRMRPWRTGLWLAGVYFPMKTRRRTKQVSMPIVRHGVNWLASMRYVRKNISDIQRMRILTAPAKPKHLTRLSDIIDFAQAFVAKYGAPVRYEPTLVPAPGRRGWTLPCMAPRPGRRGAARTWRDARAARGVLSLWVLEPPRGYRAGVQGVPWYRQKRRRKPKAPRFYTPAQFRRKVKAWDAEAIARAAAGETL